jgi:acetyl-CoA carboxylase carboxyl transferase subunit alpha
MMEHAIYSVISPEGAASILWRDAGRARDAAAALKITAQDLKKLGVIDDIVKEPPGGAHRQPELAIKDAGEMIERELVGFAGLGADKLRSQRRGKFLEMGRIG